MNAHSKPPSAPVQLAWTVSGMDCASCAATIRGAVEKLPGVSDVALSVMAEKMSLKLAPGGVDAARIEATVKALGYGAAPIAPAGGASVAIPHVHGPACGQAHGHDHAHQDRSRDAHGHGCCGLPDLTVSRFHVEGMDCGSCAAKIEKAVMRMPGVQAARVSLGAGTLTVEHMAAAGFGRVLAQTLKPLGFVATPSEVAPATRETHGRAFRGACPRSRADAGQQALVRNRQGPSRPRHGAAARRRLGVQARGLGSRRPLGLHPGLPDRGRTRGAPRLRAARLGQPFTIEMLMTLATAGALAIGAAEEAALVVFLFAVGEVLEGVAADRARASIRALGDLIPRTALLETGAAASSVPAASLQPGQIVRVRPGDRIPCDGEVIEGISGVDEAPVTGESVPRTKSPGDPVYAGSINAEALLRVRVGKAAQDNTIARIIRLVEEAQEARAPTERFIDRFSRIYMPVVVALAALTMVVPPLFAGGEWSTWIYRGLTLLLIGCPCALVISVPASIASSLAAGARRDCS